MGWVYAATLSPWLSLAWTLAAALLLQTGYFIAILIMVFGRRILQVHSPFSPSSRTDRQITSGKLPRSRARPDLER
ncbi:exopolysaccharide production repressor protein [Mesorhizobium sp. GbtcB19]|uniref:exopolysaccharide production repressor protein n=1 Tax=Mesorhizobium sp. GbtcB19 TaxID=2824764 RepID=UPI0034D5554D